MSEADAMTRLHRPEELMAEMVRDPQDGQLSAEAQEFVSELETAGHAYRIGGDPGTVIAEMPWGQRQDLVCAIALVDSTRLVKEIAGADPESGATAERVGDWTADVAAIAKGDELMMLDRALRYESVSDTPDDDNAAMAALISFFTAAADTGAQPDASSSQCRDFITGANAVPIGTLETLQGILVTNLAEACTVKRDPQENQAFWAAFVDEGARVVAEQRREVAERLAAAETVRVMARSVLIQPAA